MTRFLTALALAAILAFPITGLAATITISWEDQPDATSWVVYQSLDLGQSWTTVATVTRDSPPDARPHLDVVDAPEGQLVLYRVAAVNAQGESIRTEVGVWYNSLWKLPVAPQQVGVN